MKKITFLIFALCGLIGSGRAQTNLIEWQTNWPVGGTNSLDSGDQQNLPGSSAWFTGTKAAVLGVSTGTATNLVANVAYGSGSLTFYTYFAPTLANTNAPSPYSVEANIGGPIQLNPGKTNTIRATVNFFVTGSAAQNSGRSLRFALLYAGTNANVTGSGNGSNIGLTGYGQNMNFGTTFGVAPLQTIADTNSQAVAAPLASTAQLAQIGANGGGTTNDLGFVDNANYTLELSVTEYSPTNVSITTTFWGSTFTNGSYITQTVTDTNYCYTNFDEFIMRPALSSQTANTFNITSFKIEAFQNTSILSDSFSNGNLTLTWALDHIGWQLQSQTNALSVGLSNNWGNVAGSTTTNKVVVPVDPSKGSVFFRLMH